MFLTGHGDVSTSVRAMKAGAIDFLTKPCDDTDLLAAVERALARDAAGRAARQEQAALRERFEALTPREQEVCLRVAQGLLNKQIAAELGTAEKTVSWRSPKPSPMAAACIEAPKSGQIASWIA